MYSINEVINDNLSFKNIFSSIEIEWFFNYSESKDNKKRAHLEYIYLTSLKNQNPSTWILLSDLFETIILVETSQKCMATFLYIYIISFCLLLLQQSSSLFFPELYIYLKSINPTLTTSLLAVG